MLTTHDASWKMPERAGQGNQEARAKTDQLAAATRPCTWQFGCSHCQFSSDSRNQASGRITNVAATGKFYSVRKRNTKGLFGRECLPIARCSKMFEANSHLSPSLPEMNILTSAQTSKHLSANMNNSISSGFPHYVHVSSIKEKLTAILS